MNAQELMMKMNELLDLTRSAYEEFTRQTEAAIRAERPLLLAIDEESADPVKLQMDAALTRAAPVAIVPVHCEFEPLLENGHRFLMAADGVYLEARRPWLHIIQRLAEQKAVRMPYGAIEPKVEFAFGKVGAALAELREFGEVARLKSPIEAAASLIWNDESREFALRYPLLIGEPTGSHVQYQQIELGEHESLAIDLHSHGLHPAIFSGTDDIDDAGSVKIAGVFGNLDLGLPTVAFRLCVLGLYLAIPVPASKIFDPAPTPVPAAA